LHIRKDLFDLNKSLADLQKEINKNLEFLKDYAPATASEMTRAFTNNEITPKFARMRFIGIPIMDGWKSEKAFAGRSNGF